MPRYKSWEQVRREADVNDAEVDAHDRLAQAEERLFEARARRGISDAELARRLGVSNLEEIWGIDRGDDLYLFALARYVAAVGGRLEIRAVFDDEQVLLLSEPPSRGGSA